MPLGIFPDGDFPSSSPVTLEPGDLVLYFTDGIVDLPVPPTTPPSVSSGALISPRIIGAIRPFRSLTTSTTPSGPFRRISQLDGHHRRRPQGWLLSPCKSRSAEEVDQAVGAAKGSIPFLARGLAFQTRGGDVQTARTGGSQPPAHRRMLTLEHGKTCPMRWAKSRAAWRTSSSPAASRIC